MPTIHATKSDVLEAIKKLRPGQEIGMDKFIVLCPGGLKYKAYAIKRELMKMGMMTEKRCHGSPTKLTFHNPALPKEERQSPIKRYRPSKTNGKEESSLAFEVQPSFKLNAGTYTAEELRGLALNVLRTLGEL